MIGGVARRRTEERGDIHRGVQIFSNVLHSHHHETQSVCLLERTGIIDNLLQLVQEGELLLRRFRSIVLLVVRDCNFTLVEELNVLSKNHCRRDVAMFSTMC